MQLILRHHASYLRLASELESRIDDSQRNDPCYQLQHHPGEYYDFLRGVDASHTVHAQWFAALPELEGRRHLIDIGGGLGTFSKSWIESDAKRSALVVDLPGVQPFFENVDRNHQTRIEFFGFDISLELPDLDGDVYLVANVLHLLREWRSVLKRLDS
jgi:ubiquinone/menaquinone biosynthesis C-methylase UbiE